MAWLHSSVICVAPAIVKQTKKRVSRGWFDPHADKECDLNHVLAVVEYTDGVL